MSYLSFKFLRATESGKTSIWCVESTKGAYLGNVIWSGPWRKYVFRTIAGCDFDGNCLREIIEFCENRAEEHKEKA